MAINICKHCGKEFQGRSKRAPVVLR